MDTLLGYWTQWRHVRFSLSRHTLLLMTAVYFVLVLNAALLFRMATILAELERVNVLFVISIPLMLIAFFYALLQIVTILGAEKWIIGFLTLVSSILMYVMYHYGIIVDRDMLNNVMQTNSAEAFTYFNAALVISIIVFAGIPIALLSKVDITHTPWLKMRVQAVLAVLLGLVVFASLVGVFYKDYASVARNNSYLNKMIIPWQFGVDGIKFVKRNYFREAVAFRYVGTDAVAQPLYNGRKQLLVLIVGETARAASFSLGGYQHPTNAFTEKKSVVYFPSVSSCGTATAVSVPCMFSRLDRHNYDELLANSQDNLLDILQRTGANVRWIDNDSGCKGVCKRVQTINIAVADHPTRCLSDTCFDEVLVDELQSQLAHLDERNIIVLHMIGSHGPTYFQRYPKSFAHFLPDCARSDIQNCTRRELVNTYDNTIRYTDYVLSRVIDVLESRQDLDSAMVYLSDHGESLGEGGMYLHGLPYKFAPEEQKEVPWMMWLSPNLKTAQGLDVACLQSQRLGEFSHDHFFDSILGLAQVSTVLYREEHDVLAPCRAALPLQVAKAQESVSQQGAHNEAR